MRTYTVSVELDERGEAELLELIEHSGLPIEDVLRDALLDGLATMKLLRDADLAPPDPRPGSRALDDDLPF